MVGVITNNMHTVSGPCSSGRGIAQNLACGKRNPTGDGKSSICCKRKPRDTGSECQGAKAGRQFHPCPSAMRAPGRAFEAKDSSHTDIRKATWVLNTSHQSSKGSVARIQRVHELGWGTLPVYICSRSDYILALPSVMKAGKNSPEHLRTCM